VTKLKLVCAQLTPSGVQPQVQQALRRHRPKERVGRDAHWIEELHRAGGMSMIGALIAMASLLLTAGIVNVVCYKLGVRVERYDPSWPWLRRVAFLGGVKKFAGPLTLKQSIVIQVAISFTLLFTVHYTLEYLLAHILPHHLHTPSMLARFPSQ
jgi:hypothetical protein